MRLKNVHGKLPQTYWFLLADEKLFLNTQNCDVFSAVGNPVKTDLQWQPPLPGSQMAVLPVELLPVYL